MVGDIQAKHPQPLDSRFRGNDGIAAPTKLIQVRRQGACISLVGDIEAKHPQPLDSRFRGNDGIAAPTKLIQVRRQVRPEYFLRDRKLFGMKPTKQVGEESRTRLSCAHPVRRELNSRNALESKLCSGLLSSASDVSILSASRLARVTISRSVISATLKVGSPL